MQVLDSASGAPPWDAPDVSPSLSEPLASPVLEYLEALHAELGALDDGEVAAYIPELGTADPARFGIAVATVDGHVYEVGDTSVPFTIQSISKPFVFGLALDDRGRDDVLARVGVEPSGNPFNSITVDPATNRPWNPMVNAGAIVTTSLVEGRDADDRFDRVLSMFGRYVGHPVEIDEAVLRSEIETGDRNRAIAHLMRSFGMLEGDVDDALDRYFRQCSILVTCRDVAMMAATLANGGVNPVTGAQALTGEHVAHVLSVMSTCGMYDYTGEWVYTVGLPAKSGVAGGVVAVLPGQLGIGVFSPRLDARGNSVRGIRACQRISRDYLLHLLAPQSAGRSAVRRSYRGDEARSNRVRGAAEDHALTANGAATAVYELHGDLTFSTMERVFRTIAVDVDGVESVVLDCKRVQHIDPAAGGLLAALAGVLRESRRELVVAHLPAGVVPGLDAVGFPDVDAALEWCEGRILAVGDSPPGPSTVALREHPLLRGLDAASIAAVEGCVELRHLAAGHAVFREGDVADSVCLLLAGRVTVRLVLGPSKGSHRLATFGAGSVFGEMALFDEGHRSADVVADEECLLGVLPLAAVAELEAWHPAAAATIYRNLAGDIARRLRSANTQIRALVR